MSLEVARSGQLVSREDYLALPIDEHPSYEWDEGELIEVPPVHSRHWNACKRLTLWLVPELEDKGRATVYGDVRVNFGESYYFPDFSLLVPNGSATHDPFSGMIVGPPHLVIEVLSTTTAARDRVRKFNHYFRYGVPWYWLVDPEARTLEEYQSAEAGYLRTTAAGPGEAFQPQAFEGLSQAVDWLCPGS